LENENAYETLFQPWRPSFSMGRPSLSSSLLTAICLVLAIALVLSMASNISLTGDRDEEIEERTAYSTLISAQSLISEELWSISSNVMEASKELRNICLV